jgi:tRNA-specific 2-thiouridylase
MSKKVLLGLSGGVDSSVSALLLKEKGFDVTACWMKMTDDSDGSSAEKVASELKIPFISLDLRNTFSDSVIRPFCDEYHNGSTPNPCIRCNKLIKFGYMVNYAMENGFDYVATGHYAISQNGRIMKGIDSKKDQSYFLYNIDRKVIKKILFPLGNLTKRDVRQIAAEHNISSKDRKDSLDICFITNNDYSSVVEKYYHSVEGDILDESGNVIGKHTGLAHYTVGQRHGIDTKINSKLYVKSINPETNSITVTDHDSLYTTEFGICDTNWLVKTDDEFEAFVKIRYQAPLMKCTVKKEKSRATVKCYQTVWAPTKGQSAVFYEDDVLLGGGLIE